VTITATGRATVRLQAMRVRGIGSTGGPPPPPTESRMQEQLRKSSSEPARAELLNLLARADDWYELYKVMELAELFVKSVGGHKVFLGKECRKWKQVRYTANYPRHARTNESPALPLAEWHEARQFVVEHVSRVLLNS
jgi:hypothetical protein